MRPYISPCPIGHGLPVFYLRWHCMEKRIWYHKQSLESRTKNGTVRMVDAPRVCTESVFFRSDAGNEPVREWLKALPRDAMREVGEDIKTVQLGWPLGMPLVRKLEKDLWEVHTFKEATDEERTHRHKP